IREFDREVVGDLVGDTGMRRPSEVGDRRAVGEIGAAAEAADTWRKRQAGVLKTGGRDVRGADAGTDERRQAPPGAEVRIGVDQSNPARIAALIDVGASAAARECREIGTAEADAR